MLRFAANLSTMYHEYEFLDRFFAAARDGFTGVEYRLAYEYAATTLAGQLRENGLRLVMFNAPSWPARRFVPVRLLV